MAAFGFLVIGLVLLVGRDCARSSLLQIFYRKGPVKFSWNSLFFTEAAACLSRWKCADYRPEALAGKLASRAEARE